MVNVGNIRINNVTKNFDEVKVLNDFSLNIEPGSFVSLIGPSGCGKSTLLRIIGGLEKSYQGEVFLDGERVSRIQDAFTLYRNKILEVLNFGGQIHEAEYNI